MKKWIVKLVVALVVITAVVNVVHEFIANDTIRYFGSQPQRLLLVAAIAIIGGLAALLLDRLSPRLKRTAKLFTIGLIGCTLILFAGYFLFEFSRVSSDGLVLDVPDTFLGAVVCLAAIIAVLCFEFYQVFKRSVE